VTGTDDAARFLRDVEPLLRADPVVNNVMLSLLYLRAASPEPGRYWCIESGETVAGAVFQSPPTYPALITPMAPELIGAAVSTVVDDGVVLPGVSGDAASAAWFAGKWTERTRSAAVPTLAQRIYEIERVARPDGVAGGRRRATPADRELLVEWLTAFVAEIGDPPGDQGPVIDRRIAAGQIAIWEDGEPVAFASWTAPVATVVRIGPVYTAPDARGHGYASALVGELSADVLARAERCILYADLNNATSNAIYRALGYRAVEEVLRYRFER